MQNIRVGTLQAYVGFSTGTRFSYGQGFSCMYRFTQYTRSYLVDQFYIYILVSNIYIKLIFRVEVRSRSLFQRQVAMTRLRRFCFYSVYHDPLFMSYDFYMFEKNLFYIFIGKKRDEFQCSNCFIFAVGPSQCSRSAHLCCLSSILLRRKRDSKFSLVYPSSTQTGLIFFPRLSIFSTY